MNAAGLRKKWRSAGHFLEERIFRRELAQLGRQSWLLPGKGAFSACVDQGRRKSLGKVRICLAAGLVLTVVCALLGGGDPSLDQALTRPDFGGAPGSAALVLKAEYDGHFLEQSMRLRILPRALSASEEQDRIDLCARELGALILKDNRSLRQVSGDLDLPASHPGTGVLLSWESSDPARIDPEGRVDMLGIKPGEEVTLTATLSLGGSAQRQTYEIGFAAPGAVDYGPSLRRELEELEAELSKSDSADRLQLPAYSERKVRLAWGVQKTDPWLFPVPLCLLTAAFLYFARLSGLKSQLDQKRKAVEEELPNLSLQLTLLLNAGLVVTSAFDEILLDGSQRPHPLYEILQHVRNQCVQTNEPFVKALYRFSQTTGSRDFLRMATLIADHAARGSELADKLERERSHLWEGRLQQAHARAKEVETKLCLPLMMLLCVMVVIAVAPALMEM